VLSVLAQRREREDLRFVNDGVVRTDRFTHLPAPIFDWLSPHFHGLAPGFHSEPLEFQIRLNVVAGIFVILGHNYTCWLKFKGGKGIATSAGVLAALVPGALLIIFTLWMIVFAVSRYVSLASIVASLALPFAAWITRCSVLLIVMTSCMAALAIYKHRANIERLIKGTENRFQPRRKDGPIAAEEKPR